MTVMIERQWASMLLDHLTHQQEVALPIFLLTEDRRHDLPGGIVDGCYQAEPRPTLPQPSVAAPVDLHQHAQMARIACAAVDAAGGAASALLAILQLARCDAH
jgi:hypothetical protein